MYVYIYIYIYIYIWSVRWGARGWTGDAGNGGKHIHSAEPVKTMKRKTGETDKITV